MATLTATCSLNFSFTPKDQSTAILYGCKGHFTWEFFPTQYSDFIIQTPLSFANPVNILLYPNYEHLLIL